MPEDEKVYTGIELSATQVIEKFIELFFKQGSRYPTGTAAAHTMFTDVRTLLVSFKMEDSRRVEFHQNFQAGYANLRTNHQTHILRNIGKLMQMAAKLQVVQMPRTLEAAVLMQYTQPRYVYNALAMLLHSFEYLTIPIGNNHAASLAFFKQNGADWAAELDSLTILIQYLNPAELPRTFQDMIRTIGLPSTVVYGMIRAIGTYEAARTAGVYAYHGNYTTTRNLIRDINRLLIILNNSQADLAFFTCYVLFVWLFLSNNYSVAGGNAAGDHIAVINNIVTGPNRNVIRPRITARMEEVKTVLEEYASYNTLPTFQQGYSWLQRAYVETFNTPAVSGGWAQANPPVFLPVGVFPLA